jgi:hypothetical protein
MPLARPGVTELFRNSLMDGWTSSKGRVDEHHRFDSHNVILLHYVPIRWYLSLKALMSSVLFSALRMVYLSPSSDPVCQT